MIKQITRQQELTKEQSAAVAQYQRDMDRWRQQRSSTLAWLGGLLVIQAPLWLLSYESAALSGSALVWGGFFSIAMFLGAGIVGIGFLVMLFAVIADPPPTRPTIME